MFLNKQIHNHILNYNIWSHQKNNIHSPKIQLRRIYTIFQHAANIFNFYKHYLIENQNVFTIAFAIHNLKNKSIPNRKQNYLEQIPIKIRNQLYKKSEEANIHQHIKIENHFTNFDSAHVQPATTTECGNLVPTYRLP